MATAVANRSGPANRVTTNPAEDNAVSTDGSTADGPPKTNTCPPAGRTREISVATRGSSALEAVNSSGPPLAAANGDPARASAKEPNAPASTTAFALPLVG